MLYDTRVGSLHAFCAGVAYLSPVTAQQEKTEWIGSCAKGVFQHLCSGPSRLELFSDKRGSVLRVIMEKAYDATTPYAAGRLGCSIFWQPKIFDFS